MGRQSIPINVQRLLTYIASVMVALGLLPMLAIGGRRRSRRMVV